MIIEESFSYDNLLKHVKHVVQYINDPRCSSEAKRTLSAIESFGKIYDALADLLIYSSAGKSDDENSVVVGYINKDNRYCKYNRETQDFVSYNGKTKETITMHKKTEIQYNNSRDRDFKEELPENKE